MNPWVVALAVVLNVLLGLLLASWPDKAEVHPSWPILVMVVGLALLVGLPIVASVLR